MTAALERSRASPRARAGRGADAAAQSFERAIAGALDEIAAPGGPSPGNVHEARRCIKRARAALRLMRPSLGKAAFANEDARLAACARSLAAAREAHVLLETLSQLGKRSLPASVVAALAPLGRPLQRLGDATMPTSAALEESARSLHEAADAVHSDSRKATTTTSLEKGLRAIYRRGRKAHARACVSSTARSLHRWRTHAKYFADAVDALGDAARKGQSRRAGLARRIGDWLGEHHDLAMLDRFVAEHPGLISTEARRTLSARLGLRQRKLRERALRAGGRLYAAKARRIASLK